MQYWRNNIKSYYDFQRVGKEILVQIVSLIITHDLDYQYSEWKVPLPSLLFEAVLNQPGSLNGLEVFQMFI